MQLNHYNTKFEARKFPIVLICDGLLSPFNIGGIFRTAEAFGVEEILFLGSDTELSKRIKKTSRSAEKYVSHSFHSNFETVYKDLQNKGFQFYALEITENSIALDEIDAFIQQPLALILGAENTGVSPYILERIPQHIHINMFGINSSMNVVQSASIALYEITKQLKSQKV